MTEGQIYDKQKKLLDKTLENSLKQQVMLKY